MSADGHIVLAARAPRTWLHREFTVLALNKENFLRRVAIELTVKPLDEFDGGRFR